MDITQIADNVKRLLDYKSICDGRTIKEISADLYPDAIRTINALVELVGEMCQSDEMIVGFTRHDKRFQWIFDVANKAAIKAAPIAALMENK